MVQFLLPIRVRPQVLANLMSLQIWQLGRMARFTLSMATSIPIRIAASYTSLLKVNSSRRGERKVTAHCSLKAHTL